MDYETAKREIKKGNIALLYLLVGNEPFLMSDITEALRSKLVTSDSMESLLLFKYDARAQLPDAVFAEIASGALFDLRKLCIIRDLASSDVDKQAWIDALRKYAADPNPGAVVVCLVAGDERATKQIRTAADGSWTVVQCDHPRVGGRNGVWRKWVASYVSARGKRLSGQAQWALGTISSPSLGVLKNELDKVIAYVGSRSTIEAADIAVVCSDAAEISAFEIADRIVAGDGHGALERLGRALRQGETPFGFVGLLMRIMRNIARAKVLLGTMPRAEAIKALGDARFIAMKAVAAAGKITGKGIESAYELLLEADQAMKTGKDPGLVAETLVLELSNLFGERT